MMAKWTVLFVISQKVETQATVSCLSIRKKSFIIIKYLYEFPGGGMGAASPRKPSEEIQRIYYLNFLGTEKN